MSARCFELRRKKIRVERKPPDDEPLAFRHEDELQALVAGWPWLPGTPALLLAEEDDPIFWRHAGGGRTDLQGCSASGRQVAAALAIDPFVERKQCFKQTLRGLCRLDGQLDAAEHVAGPYAPDPQRPLTAIVVGDGAVFPKDVKQLKKIAKDFRAIIDDPGDGWPPAHFHGQEKEDVKTPAWIRALGDRTLQVIVLGLRRQVDGGQLLLTSERFLDITF